MIEGEEPVELDSDIEEVGSMQSGIKDILSKQSRPKPRRGLDLPDNEKHVLHCARIIKLDVERKLIVILVQKSDGGLRQIRIEASED